MDLPQIAINFAPVSPSKKRKLCTEDSGPCDTQAVCFEKAENLPPPTSNDKPAIPALLVQESVIEEEIDESDGLPRAKRLRGENVPTSASLTCSDVQTENVESDAGVVPVGDSIDATMTSTSANCLTVDSTSVSGQGEHEGFECVQNCESDASFDCTTFSTPIDITPPLVESTSVSGRVEDELFADVENFKIPKAYADLYKKISSKYGHMVTKKVIKSSYAIRLVCVTSLMKIASTMETVRGAHLSEALLESWEGDIKVAETLQFNIEWLREIFSRLKSSWKTSFSIDEEVQRREQVLDAEQVNYVGLISRKDELEAELLEVKTNIRKSEAKISSEREAIRQKMAEKYIFLFEPVLGNLFG
ncbi:hypothetical protein MKW92_032612 [Papaver armeniacum]|nr:hypothetical protein MKW92_032612 [Papaver armeniacum]